MSKKRADGRYDLTLTLNAKKLYADGSGKETEAPMNETVDVGAFDIEPAQKGFSSKSVIALQRMPIHSGTQTVTLVVNRAPKIAGVDPLQHHDRPQFRSERDQGVGGVEDPASARLTIHSTGGGASLLAPIPR